MKDWKGKKVINLFGGPGCGKSCISAGLFYKMKMQHMKVEMTGEYAKDLTYEKRQNILKQDQLYILAKQNRRVQRLIEESDFIISDSPLILSAVYYSKEESLYTEQIFKMFVFDLFNFYPNINFLLKRNQNIEYETIGRNQTLDEAKQIDFKVKNILDFFEIPYIEVEVDGENTVEEILKYI